MMAMLGYEHLPTRFYKHGAVYIAPRLLELFNLHIEPQ